MRQLVILALQVSIVLTVVGFGLKSERGDLRYLFTRPGLLVRSILSVFVVMPIVAVVLSLAFDLPRVVLATIIALSISPLPPVLPGKEMKLGGHQGYALGLMAVLGLVAIATVPLSLQAVGLVFDREVTVPLAAVIRIVMVSVLVPLLVGIAVQRLLPGVAARLAPVASGIGTILLLVGVLTLLVAAAPGMWAMVGNGTLLGLVVFVVIGLAVGHVLGGPARDHSSVLAFSTATRHPAIALAVATANVDDPGVGAVVLLYLLVATVGGIPYVLWVRKGLEPAATTETV